MNDPRYETVQGIGQVIGPIFAGATATAANIQVSFVGASLIAVVMAAIAAKGKMHSESST